MPKLIGRSFDSVNSECLSNEISSRAVHLELILLGEQKNKTHKKNLRLPLNRIISKHHKNLRLFKHS